ncbi:MAG: hypothetical protein R3E09_14310 [Novosphingobium sp.]|nr:hypothetical protein [Novosphingobium sp.]
MSEDQVRTVETPEGQTTHTTIVTEKGSERSSSGWLIAIALLIAVVAGVYLLTQVSQVEAVKDNAIAGAAADVGDAAQKVGNAAQDVADEVTR